MSQASDLAYGASREVLNTPRLARWLGVPLRKLDTYNVMDWVEVQEPGDESPPWLLEQKARKVSYTFTLNNYFYNGVPTALIGKHKVEHQLREGNGIVLFDFTDKLMYWMVDEAEYKTFATQRQFVRNARTGCVDKPCDVLHIPLSVLKEVPE
jgi:hypothetical protein